MTETKSKKKKWQTGRNISNRTITFSFFLCVFSGLTFHSKYCIVLSKPVFSPIILQQNIRNNIFIRIILMCVHNTYYEVLSSIFCFRCRWWLCSENTTCLFMPARLPLCRLLHKPLAFHIFSSVILTREKSKRLCVPLLNSHHFQESFFTFLQVV